jgi:hypothetical protein
VQDVLWCKVLAGLGRQVLAGNEFEDIASRIGKVIIVSANVLVLELILSLAFEQRGSGSKPDFGLLAFIERGGKAR